MSKKFSLFLCLLPLFGWEYYHDGKLESLTPLPSLTKSITRYFQTPRGIKVGVDNRLIFKPKNLACQKKILASYSSYEILPNGDILLFVKDPKEAFEVSKKIYESGCALFSHPDFLVFAKKRSFDPLFPQQWNYHNVGQYGIEPDVDLDLYEAWQYATGKGVRIALIDNGFDLTHPDLLGTFIRMIDLVDYDDDASYDNAYEVHGTACAGLVAAKKNDEGIVGAAYGAKLVGIKLIGSYPTGEDRPLYVSSIVRSFLYADDAGAEVINCSWGTYDAADAVKDVIAYIAEEGRGGRGTPIVFASGNEGRGQWYWAYDESALPSVIAIGAVTDLGEPAWYSNYGPALDFVAPSGGGVLRIATTDISGPLGYADGSYGHPDYCYAIDYTGFNGTSAAAPQVAGVIALMIQRDPDLTRKEIVDILRSTAKKIGPIPYDRGRNDYMGYGLVDADDAIKEVVRRKVIRSIKGKAFPLYGYFIRIGPGPFDWVYISADKSVVAKLDGMESDGTLRWDPVLRGAFSDIVIDGESVIFFEALSPHSLALSLGGQRFSIAGYFTKFGDGAYDWIYVDRETSLSFKLEGLDYDSRILWIDLPLQALPMDEHGVILFQ